MSDSQNSTGPSTLDSIKDKTGRTQDKVRSASKGVSDSAHSMKESMSSGSSQLRDGSRNAARNASEGARDVFRQTVNFVENNPLAAAGIGIGLALGALFPATRFENEQLGEIRDDFIDKASETGADQADKLASKADEKADQIRPDDAKPHDGLSTSSTSQSRSDDSSGVVDTSQYKVEKTPQPATQDASTATTKDLTSKGRSTTTEPAKPGDAPLPGARQMPDKKHY